LSCGGGMKNRGRTCSDPEPQYGGNDCIDNSTESQLCNEHHCPGIMPSLNNPK